MATQILRLSAVLLKTGLSRSALYRLEAAGRFPMRVRISDYGSAVGWYQHEVDEWIANRPRAVVAPKAA